MAVAVVGVEVVADMDCRPEMAAAAAAAVADKASTAAAAAAVKARAARDCRAPEQGLQGQAEAILD